MNSVLYRPPLLRRALHLFEDFDLVLFFSLLALMLVGSLMVFSAVDFSSVQMIAQLRNVMLSITVMFVIAQIPPHRIQQFAVPLYTIAISLLIAVAMVGLVKKGARRWLDLQVIVIQPSELLKIGMPLLLAWYFQTREGVINARTFFVACVLLLVPVGLIMRQPDLGTASLVLVAGGAVIFFAGLSWRFITTLGVVGVAALPLWWQFMAHDFQRDRILTLLDPQSDPLGKGFHVIQSLVAVGSGGLFGKGYYQGSQSHLDFIPEVSTDFIFALTAEEWGLMGALIVLALYAIVIGRTLAIATQAANLFSRLLSSAVAMTMFAYIFINMGMVMGIVPVVGVPLPFLSYGGTAYLSLGVAYGIVLSIAKHKRLMIS